MELNTGFENYFGSMISLKFDKKTRREAGSSQIICYSLVLTSTFMSRIAVMTNWTGLPLATPSIEYLI